MTYLAILDVGHGNSTVIRDGDEVVVVDCGHKSSGLIDFLEKENITKISKVIISHADSDHVGGLIGLVAKGVFEIKEIYFNVDATKNGKLWDDFAYLVNDLHESGVTTVNTGIYSEKEFLCGRILIHTIGPSMYLTTKGVGGVDSQKRVITSNSLSAFFKISWNNNPILFLAGDTDSIGVESVSTKYSIFKSNILVFPHHGGRAGDGDIEVFAKKLISLVDPNKVIFSIGRNKFSNPRPEVVKAIKEVKPEINIACTQLSKNCIEKIKVFSPSHISDFFSKGKDKSFCCSGTYVIKLGGSVLHEPDDASYNSFKQAATTNALCF